MARSNRTLKIIIFDGSFKTTPFINRLAKGLAENHDVYILGFNEAVDKRIDKAHYVPLGSNQNKLRFISTSLSSAIQSMSLKTFFATIGFLIKGKRHKLQQQNLRLALLRIRPDIIHLQWPSTITWFEDVLIRQNFPVVLSQRGFQNNVRPFVKPENLHYLQKWYPKIAGFHSVSKAIAANGDEIWRSSEKIDRIIYTGLPLHDLPFSDTYSRNSPLQLLSVGRTHWKKGYDYALRCCRLLKDRHIPFHYTIVGAAGTEELQWMRFDLGLEDCVALAPKMSEMSVIACMRNADLMLLPSVEEGIPNVVVEAMAVGLPVLATECGGVSELIEEGKEGWIVPGRNPRAMAEAVMDFSKSPLEKILEVRLAARKKIEHQHSEKQMIEGMEELYRKVLLVGMGDSRGV